MNGPRDFSGPGCPGALRALPGLGLVFALLAFLGDPAPAPAQVMYLDANGDGVHTTADAWYLLERGDEPTQIDVYLSTVSPDGQALTCPGTSNGLGLTGYTINLYSLDAPMLFTDVVNRMPGMIETTPLVTYPYALSVGYWGGTVFPPGTYRLLSMTVTKQPTTISPGCPALVITPYSCYSPPGVITSILSDCPGREGDGMLRQGVDWVATGDLLVCTDNPGHDPAITCPAEVTGTVGQALTFTVTLADPDCEIFSFWAYGLPAGAAFSGLGPFVAGEASGTVTWTPAPGQAGVYSMKFDANDPDYFNIIRDRRATCTTRVTVLATNQPPTADAGGPYFGVEGAPVQFDGSGSSDPEGAALVFTWDYGDGESGTGLRPTHAYGRGGAFSLTLTVAEAEGGLSDQDQTTATIVGILPVRLFTTPSNEVTRVPSGKPYTCFQLEPTSDEPFSLESIRPSSIALRPRDGACAGGPVAAVSGGSPTIRDTDGNGIPEYPACFDAADLGTFVSCDQARATATIPLLLEGELANGDRIRGEILHTFLIRSGELAASVSPNPLGPGSVLEFGTSREGAMSARLFDVQGRLLGSLAEEAKLGPGFHRIPLAAYAGIGRRLASGVYFVRVTTEHDGAVTRAVMVLK